MAYRNRAGPPFDLSEALSLYRQGQTVFQVAEKLNVTHTLLYYWLRKLKIKLRTHGDHNSSGRRAQKKRFAERDAKVRALRSQGFKLLYVAEVHGMSQQQASKICKGLFPSHFHIVNAASLSKTSAE